MENAFNPQMAKSLVEQICDALTNAIIEGTLKPGEPLTEISLQQTFGVSRTPIREAYRILERKGLLEVIPRKGTYVKVISEKDIVETFPVRAILEGYAARLAAEKMTDAQLAEMDVCLKEMVKSAQENNFRSFMLNHYDFHRCFISCSGNDLLKDILDILLEKAIWFRCSFLYFHQNYSFSIDKHEEILGLFMKRDKDGVGMLVKEHIEVAKDNFLAFVRQKGKL